MKMILAKNFNKNLPQLDKNLFSSKIKKCP